MKFEEYAATYPDVCSGCRAISFFYDSFGQGRDIPNEARCIFFDYGDLSKYCPCVSCLIKVKCLEPCSLFDRAFDTANEKQGRS